MNSEIKNQSRLSKGDKKLCKDTHRSNFNS
jgi:hypothetical protein